MRKVFQQALFDGLYLYNGKRVHLIKSNYFVLDKIVALHIASGLDMTQFGLDIFLRDFPKKLRGRKAGILCHASSITSSYTHILDVITNTPLTLGAVFGPQHGLFGQTQDNMIEWEGGYKHPVYNVPVYSLYGKTRKPTAKMLHGLEVFIVDLQDVGARPYTYIWTVKQCMEACMEQGIPLWILDRPNPIAAIPFDGPMLREGFFTFVGGAEIPLCHRMTLGEMALLLKQKYFSSLDIQVVWMKDWWRDSLYHETGLPWVFPSPNMPSESTAYVYPGMVLFEATNLSEGRGTTLPFELFGAPFINMNSFRHNLNNHKIPGCIFREHNFIPTFQKWQGEFCYGMQVHVTNPRAYQSVFTSASIIESVIRTTESDAFAFKEPPYEYEHDKIPFDILSGDSQLRTCLLKGGSLMGQQIKWREERKVFLTLFDDIAYYPEKRA